MRRVIEMVIETRERRSGNIKRGYELWKIGEKARNKSERKWSECVVQ